MPARLELVPIGNAFPALAAAVRDAQRDDPLTPVWVLVDAADAATPLRRRLARGARAERRGGLAAVQVLSMDTAAQQLARRALAARGVRRLTRPVLAEALRQALVSAPGVFAPVVGHPATVDELVGAYEELRFADAARAGALSGAGRWAADAARLCAAVRARVSQEFFDDVDVLETAAGAVAGGAAPASVVCYLPERLRPAEAALLGALGALVLVATTGDVVADAGVRALVEVAAAAAITRSGGALPPGGSEDPLAAFAPVCLDDLLEAPDPGGAARAAFGEVLAALGRGVPPERCAVVAPRRDAQLDLLRRVAGSIDAPADGSAGPLALASHTRGGASLATTRGAVVLRDLVHCARAGTLERHRVISLLGAARAFPLHGGGPPLAAAERCSRRAGIVKGDAARWRVQLSALAEADPSLQGDARLLAGAADAIERSARSAAGCRSWAEFSTWCRRALAVHLPADPEAAPFERRAEDALSEALQGLAELDLVGGAARPGLDAFAEALARALERPLTHPGATGSGVLVGDLDDVRGGDFDLVVVVGLQEGVLPARPIAGAVLDDRARTAAGLPPRGTAEALARDRRRLLLAAAAGTRVVGIVVAADMGGRDLHPSRFVDPSAPRRRHPGLVASLLGAGAGDAWSIRDLGCAPLAATARAGVPAVAGGVADRLALRARVASSAARALGEIGPYTGVVDASAVARALARRPLAATPLEAYAACPFRFFAAHLLGCEAVDEPETRLALDPRDRGLLVHRILQRFVAEQISDDTGATSAGSAPRLVEIAEEEFERLRREGRAGKEVLFDAERRAILEWLEDERQRDAERRESGRRPVAVEVAFGTDALPPLERTAGGVPLRFSGRIDRVDKGPGDQLQVVDYKTARNTAGYRGLESDPVDRGLRLQLPLYGLAARTLFPGGPKRQVTAAYRLIGDRPAEFPVALAQGTEARLDEVLGTLVGGVRGGLFPHRPGTPGSNGDENCRYCDFDALCPPERARLWAAARADARLAAFVALAEGEDREGDEGAEDPDDAR